MTMYPLGSGWKRQSVSEVNNEKKQLKAFISYSAKDKLIGDKIKEILARFGIDSFLAHNDINISERWKKRILEELNEADVFIPILSYNFRNSGWCSQEAGIACFREILIIPLSLDGVIPYGFMEEWQGKSIDENNIPLDYLLNPISNKFPEINIIGKLIDELKGSRSYRNAEGHMGNLEPYFDKLKTEEINRIVDSSIANNQIWPAGLCRTRYLPKFIEINEDKIDEDKLKELKELMEKDV